MTMPGVIASLADERANEPLLVSQVLIAVQRRSPKRPLCKVNSRHRHPLEASTPDRTEDGLIHAYHTYPNFDRDSRGS